MHPGSPVGGVEVVDDVELLYAAAYPRLVSVVAVAAGSRAEAEEVVQEAFARLLPRWSAVSRYDDPEAWVRTVAVRLLSNRFRKARNGRTAYARHGAPDPVEEPSADRVDLDRALAGLPAAQRHALVLHHLCGLPVAQVAADLGVPVATVKARLQRGRAALAPLLREEADRV